MRYLRHRRYSTSMNYERHGDAFQADINGPLTISIVATKTVAAGSALTIGSTVSGGFTPYTYVWKKDGVVLTGKTTGTMNIPASAVSDSGSYTLEVTDAKGTKVVSNACVATVTA